MLNAINSLFVNVLNWLYGLVGNYGWTVVVFTLLIRLIVLPLDIKSRKSMRAMNRVQPKLQELQKKYADDQEKLQKKMMELYKKENVSPTAGCLPMLLQFPILIFMFTAMRVVANEQTIQMILNIKDGIAPTLQGWLWIKNVFQPDSFMSTILPAVGDKLMAITPVSYSAILTADNIEMARQFLTTTDYATVAAQYGTAAFHQIQLNFAIVQPIVTMPTSIANLFQAANGLFLLPLAAGVSQYFMTQLTAGAPKESEEDKLLRQAGQAQDNAAANNPMNSGMMKWFFPLFSVWICATSNSAFSIYWMTVNVIQIVSTAVMNYVFDKQDAELAAKESA